ncbi:energy-coupling factor transporter transmembrane component T family protein [Streptococcus parauberis]|uniref:energy-coupling factor transporter transmembrane component T family protein n=1 Tax=Streptococcus parauberis TaxID=1348 RepID=UPI000C15AE67|nr:energy-coupling factor transporter transmembrane component T [Streptococcus parauberis]PIA85271.1 Energy-coupling factor transporter transmembrane protein EcfT [Streptococcus parauberis]PNY22763.1 Energy-coupling factor transporter transmembrane protein EcfT [Streptococcus parauberis]
MPQKLIGYQKEDNFLHHLTGASKLIFFILVSVACMTTYDTRLIIFIGCLSLTLFASARVPWKSVSFVIKFVTFFAILNVLMVYLFAPAYGEQIYHSKTVIANVWGPFYLTKEELFYLFNLSLKYFSTVPLALLFLLTTNPSQFASSLNQIGLPYEVAYAVSLTLRYIPDVQEEFYMIKTSQEARGLELSKKAKLFDRIKGNLQIIIPLIFSSLDRIDLVATAMELRRFGKNKRRTWYTSKQLDKNDIMTIFLAIAILLTSFILFVINKGRFYNPFTQKG